MSLAQPWAIRFIDTAYPTVDEAVTRVVAER